MKALKVRDEINQPLLILDQRDMLILVSSLKQVCKWGSNQYALYMIEVGSQLSFVTIPGSSVIHLKGSAKGGETLAPATLDR